MLKSPKPYKNPSGLGNGMLLFSSLKVWTWNVRSVTLQEYLERGTHVYQGMGFGNVTLGLRKTAGGLLQLRMCAPLPPDIRRAYRQADYCSSRRIVLHRDSAGAVGIILYISIHINLLVMGRALCCLLSVSYKGRRAVMDPLSMLYFPFPPPIASTS